MAMAEHDRKLAVGSSRALCYHRPYQHREFIYHMPLIC